MHLMQHLPFLSLFSQAIWSASASTTPESAQRVFLSGSANSAIEVPEVSLQLGQWRRQAKIVEQNSTICDAGSRQWSGTIPVGEGRDMFFWYFESRESPETAPLTIWLNGGPGASSLLGAFHEIGPCRVNEDGTATVRAESTWTNFSNMLFIDQPIGVGFSDPKNPDLWAESLNDAAIDLDIFLDAFLGDHFPNLRQAPLHLAGESFGGRYCPVYADLMRRSFSSVILVDALVDFSQASLGFYDHFCSPDAAPSQTGFNTSACGEMATEYSSCENIGRLCEATYDARVCSSAFETCYAMTEPYQRQVVAGGQNPYDDRKTCNEPPICGGMGMEQVAAFLNRDWVQDGLQIEHMKFETVNMGFGMRWSANPAITTPSTRELSRLLDNKKTPILVLNGNNDVVVNTEGILRVYDSLLWSGHAAYRNQALQKWYFADDAGELVVGGQMKTAQNLAVVTIDEAGHMSPYDQPEAVLQLMRRWTEGGAAAVQEMTTA